MRCQSTISALIGVALAFSLVACEQDLRRGTCASLEAHPVDATSAFDTKPATSAVAEPRNFSWVVERQLAGMAHPGHGAVAEQRFDYLAAHAVSLVVSLTESAPVSDTIAARGMDHLHLPVVDFTAPSLEQLDHFVTATADTIAQGGRVVVHCAAGQGRTGTFLAAWFVATGLSSDEAIDHVRSLRPGSIETAAQLEIVSLYADLLD